MYEKNKKETSLDYVPNNGIFTLLKDMKCDNGVFKAGSKVYIRFCYNRIEIDDGKDKDIISVMLETLSVDEVKKFVSENIKPEDSDTEYLETKMNYITTYYDSKKNINTIFYYTTSTLLFLFILTFWYIIGCENNYNASYMFSVGMFLVLLITASLYLSSILKFIPRKLNNLTTMRDEKVSELKEKLLTSNVDIE